LLELDMFRTRVSTVPLGSWWFHTSPSAWGKPNLKEKGMSGVSYGWAVAWAWALSPL
jgi:hypothetical protein